MDRLELPPRSDDRQDQKSIPLETSELLERARVATDLAHLQIQRTRMLLEEYRENKSGYERL